MSASPNADACRFYNSLQRPLLILSSRAGRGNTSIGEAIHEHFSSPSDVYHQSIEEYLPPSMVAEDLRRYKLISNHFPLALAAIYTVPLFYYRKLLRERLRTTHLGKLKDWIESHRIATIVCVSHRQAFWTTVLKRNASLKIAIYGVLTEFGPSLGWRHIFWNEMDGFISPLQASTLRLPLPPQLVFKQLPLTARSSFFSLANVDASPHQCLLVGGLWGQGRMMRTLLQLTSHFGGVHVHAVCGDNTRLKRKMKEQFALESAVTLYGLQQSLQPLLARCGCVVTKPGMATILEAHAAGRKIFLFKGMPVAESHNAQYALDHFDAEWFSVPAFSKWLASAAE